MSLRLDMLQAARSAPNRLPEAGDRVVEFLLSQFNNDGGARNRAGRSDLYYTVFALDGLAVLGAEPDVGRTPAYLRSFGDGEGLDFVHRACLARCWSAMPAGSLDEAVAGRLLRGIEGHRCADGGYSPVPGSDHGTAYGCFLALGAYQDLGAALPYAHRLGDCLASLRTDDGAFANERGFKFGMTPATAAVAVLMRQVGLSVPPTVGDWLLERCSSEGGFMAAAMAPIPDLLSTATALHALATLGVSFEHIRQPCLDFLDSLWTGRAYRGHLADDVEDCEYAFYGLLALGHLDTEG